MAPLRLPKRILDLLVCDDHGGEHVAQQELPRAFCDVLIREVEPMFDVSPLRLKCFLVRTSGTVFSLLCRRMASL